MGNIPNLQSRDAARRPGTATDTINTALAEVVRRDDLGGRLVDLVPPDLTPEMLRQLRTPRTF